MILKYTLLLTFALLIFTGCGNAETADSAPMQPLEEYYAKIDYTCESDADCEIKDIHNCCGYYPACTNKEASLNPQIVKDICREGMITSVCGFPSIESCVCVENKCEDIVMEPKL